jgi:hypothetical protein
MLGNGGYDQFVQPVVLTLAICPLPFFEVIGYSQQITLVKLPTFQHFLPQHPQHRSSLSGALVLAFLVSA